MSSSPPPSPSPSAESSAPGTQVIHKDAFCALLHGAPGGRGLALGISELLFRECGARGCLTVYRGREGLPHRPSLIFNNDTPPEQGIFLNKLQYAWANPIGNFFARIIVGGKILSGNAKKSATLPSRRSFVKKKKRERKCSVFFESQNNNISISILYAPSFAQEPHVKCILR